MKPSLDRLLACLGTDRRGSSVPFFAIGGTVLVAFSGMAVDLGRGELARADLQRAVDAAALATAAEMIGTGQAYDEDTELQDGTVGLMRSVVMANLDQGWGTAEVDVSYQMLSEPPGVKVKAVAHLPTTLIRVLGPETLPIAAEAAATGGLPPMEIALVIDTSTSVGDDLPTLKEAARGFVETLFGSYETLEETYVSVTPFSQRVQVGREDWLSSAAPSGWEGCTDERSGDPLSYLDRVPSLAAFPPFEPSSEDWGECAHTPILPLQNEKSTLLTYIDDMAIEPGTCADIGFAWGVRTVSPEWRGLWGDPDTPLGMDKRGKAVVLMTDGRSDDDCTRDYSSRSQTADLLLSYCSEMKGRGYVVVTVAIDTPEDYQDILRSCASTDAYFYEIVNWADLPIVSRGIASDVGGGKVRRISLR